MTAVGTPAISTHVAHRVGNPEGLARLMRSGERIFLPGSGAEVPALTEALFTNMAPALDITASFVPGINAVPVDSLPVGARYTSSFAQASPRGTQGAGWFRHLPLSYGGFAAYLSRQDFDVGIVHVSPPDASGLCSFGIAVEFMPVVLRNCRRVFAVINPRMPRISGSAVFDLAMADAIAETDAPLSEYDVGAPTAQASRIAAHVAAFVEDGATLQVGLGKTPDALMRLVADRRELRLHSGMLSDAARILAESGSLDPRRPSVSCVHVGTARYYDWLAGRDDFQVRGCDFTHAPAVLAGLERLVAVNAAFEVDLFGQANLEMLDGRMMSGVGGAADFAHAASLSPDGVSIVALPATAGRSGASRVVPRLGGICSLPRHAVDVVVTEYGAADLRGATVIERAERLVAIAAPDHQSELQDAWKEIAARF